jgi:hypothetical protein
MQHEVDRTFLAAWIIVRYNHRLSVFVVRTRASLHSFILELLWSLSVYLVVVLRSARFSIS